MEEFWDDFLGFRIGPLRMGASLGPLRTSYSRTADSHILRLKIDPRVKKEDIKVRFLKPGLLEVEWPRRAIGEEIPVE